MVICLIGKRLLKKAPSVLTGMALAVCSVAVTQHALAQDRYRPANNDIVLANSVHAQGGTNGAFKALDTAWRAQPQNLDVSLAFARAVFTMGLTQGDLRWFGSAKAALMPWWAASELPAEGYFLRGLVKQGFHDFDAGLQDINKAIDKEPQRAEFWSWRFALHLLMADLSAARQDIEEMTRLLGPEEARIYRAVLHYRSGQPQPAIGILKAAWGARQFQDPSSQDWIGFHLGEAYRVAGQADAAIGVWQKQLQANPQSHLIRLSLADLLNQRGDYRGVKKIIPGDALSDALLMQSLLASRGLKDGDEPRLANLLGARLQSQAQRKDDLIERPKLIYLITYGQDPATGLALSIDNWKLQQEPPDAVLFIQAALAVNQPRAAEPVVRWAEKTGYTEPQLAKLLQQLKVASGRTGGVQ